jgi:Domain of unknown function (DUF4129)
MTGSNPPPWSWLYNALVPMVLVGAEATWASLCLSAAVNSSRHFSMDLPFAAVAVPAVTAAGLCALIGRPKWRWWWRAALVVVLVPVGTTITAGMVSQYSVPGSFVAVAYHPWSIVGRVPSATAALAWFVASVSWVRGAWLGLQNLSFRHALSSVVTSSCAFIVLFAVLASNPERALHAATPDAAALFVVFFTGAVAVLALLRERDLETEALGNAGSRPSAVWIGVLGIPMLIVAGLALLVAAGVGPLAPAVGRGTARAVLAVAGAIAALALAIGRLFPRGHPSKVHPPASGSPLQARPVSPQVVTSHGTVHVPEVVGIIALALVVGFVAIVIVRGVRRLSVRRGPTTRAIDEETDSVFSWRHLFEQLCALLVGLFTRKRHQTAQGTLGTIAMLEAQGSGVRREYSRFLGESGSAGIAKYPYETTREFARRLQSPASVLAGDADDLQLLTDLYDRVRYGGYVDSGYDVATAGTLVDRLIRNLPVRE